MWYYRKHLFFSSADVQFFFFFFNFHRISACLHSRNSPRTVFRSVYPQFTIFDWTMDCPRHLLCMWFWWSVFEYCRLISVGTCFYRRSVSISFSVCLCLSERKLVQMLRVFVWPDRHWGSQFYNPFIRVLTKLPAFPSILFESNVFYACVPITKISSFKRFDSALVSYRRLLAADPKCFKALFGIARSLDRLAEAKRSNAFLQEAIDAYLNLLAFEELPDDIFVSAAQRAINRLRFRGTSKFVQNQCSARKNLTK